MLSVCIKHHSNHLSPLHYRGCVACACESNRTPVFEHPSVINLTKEKLNFGQLLSILRIAYKTENCDLKPCCIVILQNLFSPKSSVVLRAEHCGSNQIRT